MEKIFAFRKNNFDTAKLNIIESNSSIEFINKFI